MTSFGQFPLVYQLRQLSDGSFMPVGLAESSSIAFFSATTLVVSSISATNYQGLNLSSIEITGVVVSIDTTGTGIPIIDTTTPTTPKIRSFAVSLDSFLTVPSVNPGDGEVTLGWGASPLSFTHGGTNSNTIPSNDSIAYWYDGGSGSELTTNAGFSFDGTNISIPNTGQYQVNNSQITLSNLAGITSPGTLEDIPAPSTDNTFLKYNTAGGGTLSWAAGGSVSYPNFPGRLPVIGSTTELVSYADFSYASATKTLSVYAINNVCDVCAVRINEDGQLLSVKYQGKDDTLTAIAGLNPGTNELIYFTNTNAAATASLTDQGRQLLDDGSFAAMRTTLQLGNIATRDITSPPAGGLYFESDPTGTINTNSNLTFTTNILKSPNVCATTVCATTFTEGGQTLSTKYQGFDSFLNDLATQNTVNLSTQVCGSLPVSKGGTGVTTLGDNQILVGTGTETLATITSPESGPDNTFLKWTGSDFIWTGVATGTSTSIPNQPGRIPIIYSDTALVSYSELSYASATKALSVYAINNVCDVCAVRINEDGQLLSVKYQGKDATLDSISNLSTGSNQLLYFTNTDTAATASLTDQGRQLLDDSSFAAMRTTLQLSALATKDQANLTTDVVGTLPVTNGGTNRTSFTSNQLIYGQFDQNSNLTFDGTTFLKSPAVCATTVCGADLFENGVNITAKYETQTNAANTYTTKSTYNTFTGTLALSAGLKDVIINAPSNGEVLKWNGANWANATDAGGATIPNGPYAWDGVYIYQDSIPGIDVVQPSTNTKLYYLQSSNGVVKWTLESLNQVQITAPEEFTRNASATQFSGIIIDELSSVDHWNENSYIFYAEVNTLSATNISATNYYNLPNVSALNGTGVFEVTSYSRSNFVLTGTNLALSNTVSNHIASAVHWELSTLNNNYINASGDSANASFFLQDLSATNLSATNYSNLPSSTITWLNAYNAQTIRKYVKNTTGSTIAKGRAVTVVSATGDNVLVAPLSSVNTHVPEAIGFSNHVFGLTETEILNDDFGYIITEGILSGTGGGVNALDTSLFSAGDILYVSSNGLLSNTRPPAPYEAHPVGYVIRSQSNVGSIYVKIETVPEINDIVGFNLASSLVNGDLITYDLTTSTFVNKQSIDVTGLIKGGSVSATTYLNLPSGTATWNANKIQSVSVCATAPSRDNQLLAYDLVANSWKAGLAVSSGSGAPAGGVDGDIYIQYFDTVDVPTDASSLRGYQITSTAPVNNNILRYNGTAWVPSASAILQSVSAASYLNYPVTQAAGTAAGAIQFNNGTNGFDADDLLYYSAKNLYIQQGSGGQLNTDTVVATDVQATQMSVDTVSLTSPAAGALLVNSSLRSPTVSATTYLNLPSGVATWNASALRGFTVSSTTPTNNRVLTYVSAASAWNPQPLPAEIGVACSDETTNLTSGTAKATFRMPYAMTLTSVRANVNTAPVGSTILVDVNKNGSTIFSTRVSIDASEKTSVTAATPFVLSTTSLADDDEITVDIDQVGSSTAGKGLKIWLIGTRA
jgi:hypothetical protein